MSPNRVCQYLIAAVVACGVAGAQTPKEQDQPIQLLQFSMTGVHCVQRHCDLDLSADNALTPHPVVGLPGGRLYVRIFRDSLAHLKAERPVERHHCITYSTIRAPLDISPHDDSFIFGAQMQSLLYDVDLLYDAPSQENTVVLVFETEPENQSKVHSSVLKLASQSDVQKYFRYAIEVTFTLDGRSFADLQKKFDERNPDSAKSQPAGQSVQKHSQSLASAIGAFIAGWFHPSPVFAKPATPPIPPAAAPNSADSGEPALFSNEVKVLPDEQCSSIVGYSPAGTTYTVGSLTPVAEIRLAPCGG